jgi:hypothetical protein
MQPSDNKWFMCASTINQTKLTGSFRLLNEHTIHEIFGKLHVRKKYAYCRIEGTENLGKDEISIKLVGCVADSLDELFGYLQRTNPPVNTIWIYIYDQQYIIYIEDLKFLCMDYGHFDQGDTPIIEIQGLTDPLRDMKEFKDALAASHKMLVDTELLLSNGGFDDPSKCSFCDKSLDPKSLVTCSRCKYANYCGRTCQGKGLNSHQKICGKIQKLVLRQTDPDKEVRSIFDLDVSVKSAAEKNDSKTD